MSRTKELVKKLKEDERYLRLKKSFSELPYFNIPVEDISSEIEALHKYRTVRTLNLHSPSFSESLIQSSCLEQSVRSRLSEILLSCIKAEKSLNSALSSLREYLMVQYAEELSFIRTKGERTVVIDMSLSVFIKYVDKVKRLSDECRLIIEDIDKCSYTLKNIIETLKITHKPERSY